MALIDLKCSSCGSPIKLDTTKDTGFCMYCGNKFLVKDETTRIAIEHSGSVELTGSVNVNREQEALNLIIRAKQMLNNSADPYSERYIDRASNYVGYLSNFVMNNYIKKAMDLAPMNKDVIAFYQKVSNSINEKDDANKKKEKAYSTKVNWGLGIFAIAFILMMVRTCS